MIAGALAAIAAISIIGYVVAISLGRQPTKDLLTVAMVALIASCTTAAPLNQGQCQRRGMWGSWSGVAGRPCLRRASRVG